MKVLVTGAKGQLGQALIQCAPENANVVGLSHDQLDVGSSDAVRQKVQELRPDLIFNAAAYTAVDAAESNRELAFRINSLGSENLARAAKAVDAQLWHVSTDFVFDGSLGRPYKPSDEPRPLNYYGETKLAGEQRAMSAFPEGVSVVRSAWIYAPCGRNFVRTILRLLSAKPVVSVVADQIGTPTSANGLAMCLWELSGLPTSPAIWHWTDAGVASWYDFAVSIRELAALRWPERNWGRVEPICSVEFPTAARRAFHCLLDKTETWAKLGKPPHWSMALQQSLDRGEDMDWLPPA